MFCKNIASLAVAMETCDTWILAKRAIFLKNILWERCSKLNSTQLSHSMSAANIANLADINKIYIILIQTLIELSQKALGQLFDFGQKITTHTGLSNQGLVAALGIDLDPGGPFRAPVLLTPCCCCPHHTILQPRK